MVDGAVEEVENPENASGASLFRFVTFKATDKVCHMKKVETDKPKMMPMAQCGLGLGNEGRPQSFAEHWGWQAVSCSIPLALPIGIG